MKTGQMQFIIYWKDYMKNYNKIEIKLNIKQISVILIIIALLLGIAFVKIIHTKYVNYKLCRKQ